MSRLGKESAAFKQAASGFKHEAGNLEKLLAAAKAFFAKEFLWVLLLALLGLLLALIATYVLTAYATPQQQAVADRLLKGKPRFVGAYVLSLVGLYFTRMVVAALRAIAKKKDV